MLINFGQVVLCWFPTIERYQSQPQHQYNAIKGRILLDFPHMPLEEGGFDHLVQPIGNFPVGFDYRHSQINFRSYGAWRLAVFSHSNSPQMKQIPLSLQAHEACLNHVHGSQSCPCCGPKCNSVRPPLSSETLFSLLPFSTISVMSWIDRCVWGSRFER